ncbi:MAG: amino acid adenylation domain-containing protein [Clostridium sp.]|nr:amino acid adenylation domain-containing protein [Clostridium sp.]MCM1398493.1 amino acid adenylation domain-containing protein [Clostridium sp.]MCM1460215.1 amino acid adenylation domain-containing protein [Bacteroides sp.]
MKNVLEYLEESTLKHPDKQVARDDKEACTYKELMETAKGIGTLLAAKTCARMPVVVFMDKSVACLKVFMGTLYSGCFYSLVDPSFPDDRIRSMLDTLQNDIVITKKEQEQKLRGTGYMGQILFVEDFNHLPCDEAVLSQIRNEATDMDGVYCNFTSGSTGVPKGVLVCHRSIIDFIDHFTELFHITETDVIGNQAPFDFDVSVKDIYSTLKAGATIVMIPKAYFMFPNQVVDMLDKNNVTTLIWAVSALCLLNRLHGLKYKVPANINKILFSGEMMPIKQLNGWRSHYPDAMFVNLYGPTEITCNCTYYILDREFAEDEMLPMGHAFPNERVFLLDENDKEITKDMPNVTGELCVAGTCLALGYYNNKEMTEKAFTINPLEPRFPEVIYRTGDLGYRNEESLLFFAGRKDFQIKHMGHRIELEEIESVLGGVSCVSQGCCFFDEEKSKVVACYVGDGDKRQIVEEMRKKVPDYMVPNVFIVMDELPVTKNGKTDRALLKETYKKGRK